MTWRINLGLFLAWPAMLAAQPEVPSAAELAAARADEADQLFALLLEEGDPEDLLYRILIHAGEQELADATRYLLITRALEHAVQTGRLVIAMDSLMALSASFQVDAYELKSQTLLRFAEVGTLPASVLCCNYLELATQAAGAESDARMLAAWQQALTTAGQDPHLVAWVRWRKRELNDLHRAWRELAGPMASSAQLGQYLCFYRGDWQAGVPLLSDADTPGPLRVVAKKRAVSVLRTDLSAGERASLGDAWLARASPRRRADKMPALAEANIRRRALHWYRLAWPELTGARKARVLRQIGKLEDHLAENLGLGRIRFLENEDLGQMLLAGGEWQIVRRRLVGLSGSETCSASSRHLYSSISAVTVRGGILSRGNLNFRLAVGDLKLIFNWELAPENHFYYGGQRTVTTPHAMTWRKQHQLNIRQFGAEIVVFLDDKEIYRVAGELAGAVSVYPALGSEIFVREILIDGEIDTSEELVSVPEGLR